MEKNKEENLKCSDCGCFDCICKCESIIYESKGSMISCFKNEEEEEEPPRKKKCIRKPDY